MSTIGTSPEFARALQSKLADGDLDWLRARFLAGDLNFLRDLLPANERVQFPRRLEDRDLMWIRTVLAGVVIPGVGPLAVPPPAFDVPPPAPAAPPPLEFPVTHPIAPQPPTGYELFGADEPTPVVAHLPTPARSSSRRWLLFALPVAVVLALVAVVFVRSRGDEPVATPVTTAARVTTAPSAANLARTLNADPRLSTLAAMVGAAGLTDILADPTSALTVFAPTNDAFAALPAAQREALLADPAALRTVVQHHITSGRWTSAVAKAGPLPVLAGAPLTIARTGNTLTVDGATVVSADLVASNGIVHVIDRVLLPAGPGTGGGSPASTTASSAAPVTTAPAAPATTGPATSSAATTGAVTTGAVTTGAVTTTGGPVATTGPGIDATIKFPAPNGVTLDAAATAATKDLAATIARLPAGATVKVTGWSDTRNGDRVALEQSKARADAVVAALRSAGATNVTYAVTGAGGRWAAVYADARVVEVDLP